MPITGPAINWLSAAASVKPGEGSWWDRLTAAYEEQQRADKYFAQQNPALSTGAQVMGGFAGMGPMVAAAPTRALFGMGNLPWNWRVITGTTGGAGINALDALLRREDPISAAEIGGAGGLVGPALGAGARVGATGLTDFIYPRSGPLASVPRKGINLLAGALEGETPQSLTAARRTMGPAGFFADVTQGTTDVTGGLADLPGPQKALVQDAYRARAAQQGARIEAAVTKATGIPETFNVVDQEKFLTEARAKAADPLYQQWRSAQVHPTKELQELIPRLEKAGAFDMAEELSGISGRPIDRKFFVGGPRKEFPTTEAWDYVKRGLDRRIDQAYSAGDKTLARELVTLKGHLVSEIEKTSAGQIWKQARAEFADRSALIDQLAAGRDTFLGGRAGLSPDELAEELRNLSRPEIIARIQGMRAAVRDAMGDKTENASRIRSQLLAPNNQKKMRMLIGDQEADELIATLQSEKHLADKLPAIVPNMSTGASTVSRAERRNMFAPTQVPPGMNILEPRTWPIVGRFTPENLAQSLLNTQAERVPTALAPIMLTPQGPQMDNLIAAILREGEQRSRMSRRSRLFVENPVAGLVAGPGTGAYRRSYENQPQR
jgi:hypothetical protein